MGTFGPRRVYLLLHVNNGMPVPLGISTWGCSLNQSKCTRDLRGPKVPQRRETKIICNHSKKTMNPGFLRSLTAFGTDWNSYHGLYILSRASKVGSPTNQLGSGQRQDTGQESLDRANLVINYQKLKKTDQPLDLFFTKAGWAWHVTIYFGNVGLLLKSTKGSSNNLYGFRWAGGWAEGSWMFVFWAGK